jgi:hypothetical protein
LGLLAALGTDGREHFLSPAAESTAATSTTEAAATSAAASATTSTTAGRFLSRAARGAALGFIGESELSVTLLLAGCKCKSGSTIDTGELFVRIHFNTSRVFRDLHRNHHGHHRHHCHYRSPRSEGVLH